MFAIVRSAIEHYSSVRSNNIFDDNSVRDVVCDSLPGMCDPVHGSVTRVRSLAVVALGFHGNSHTHGHPRVGSDKVDPRPIQSSPEVHSFDPVQSINVWH